MKVNLQILANQLDEVEKRVRPTICNTYTFSQERGSYNEQQGTINEHDANTILEVMTKLREMARQYDN